MNDPLKELEGFYEECRSAESPQLSIRRADYRPIARCLLALAAGVAVTMVVANGAGSSPQAASAADVSWLIRKQCEANGITPTQAVPATPRHTETRSWHA